MIDEEGEHEMDQPSAELQSEALDEYLDDMEEMDLNQEDLVIPEDVDNNDEYGLEDLADEDGENEMGEGMFGD